MHSRRQFLRGAGVGIALAVSGNALAIKPSKPSAEAALRARWVEIERRSGGRLGISLLDTATGQRIEQRQDERFPLCSTFKFLLVAAVLQRVDRGELRLDRQVPIRAEDMLSYAPATKPHVGGSLSLAELCQAAMIFSDGVAANLLLTQVGDPVGLTAFIRTLGDTQTRSDRNEPSMNNFALDDPRDTTTPAAMLGSMRAVLLGDALQPASRKRLTDWMIDNRTGDDCLRAGFPQGWKVGDKTGNNGTDSRNDIGIVWVPGQQAPLLLTTYLNKATVDADARDAALKAVAQAVAAWWPTRAARAI
ncbi:class A beta-lactamase [Xanthomonas prunicola]|uniref:Beta-lactamase n=1 Tax=Xanthomonas prunicola TaxID=2053930 RepID=A0A2N3RNH9_9XANT|nr:class A beta-lactamase [Xanthomonas prunicola]PKV14043.1 class A beta-lactamase [Xanthomonas prunicola]PKV18324.1 class A beta-lactamase [Xanthomonas prunicola]PKV22365.1 class A beta-lactamase [Xanthomonas prunicola]